MSTKKKRRIKPPTDVSYGLFELAARAAGFSQLGIMEQTVGPEAAARAVKGLKKLTGEGKTRLVTKTTKPKSTPRPGSS